MGAATLLESSTGKPLSKYRCSRRGPSISAAGLAIPTTPQLRDHQKIHHRKAEEAGQKPLLNEAAHQPPRIEHADHQLSKPKDRHLDGKRREGKTPFRCTETKHSQPPIQDTHSADLLLKAMSSRPPQPPLVPLCCPLPKAPQSCRQLQRRKLALRPFTYEHYKRRPLKLLFSE